LEGAEYLPFFLKNILFTWQKKSRKREHQKRENSIAPRSEEGFTKSQRDGAAKELGREEVKCSPFSNPEERGTQKKGMRGGP